MSGREGAVAAGAGVVGERLPAKEAAEAVTIAGDELVGRAGELLDAGNVVEPANETDDRYLPHDAGNGGGAAVQAAGSTVFDEHLSVCRFTSDTEVPETALEHAGDGG